MDNATNPNKNTNEHTTANENNENENISSLNGSENSQESIVSSSFKYSNHNIGEILNNNLDTKSDLITDKVLNLISSKNDFGEKNLKKIFQ